MGANLSMSQHINKERPVLFQPFQSSHPSKGTRLQKQGPRWLWAWGLQFEAAGGHGLAGCGPAAFADCGLWYRGGSEPWALWSTWPWGREVGIDGAQGRGHAACA